VTYWYQAGAGYDLTKFFIDTTYLAHVAVATAVNVIQLCELAAGRKALAQTRTLPFTRFMKQAD